MQESEIIDFSLGRTAHPCGLSIDRVWGLTDTGLRRRLERSFTRKLSCCGFGIRAAGAVLRVSPAADFPGKSRRWVFPHSPRYKRITRILESVSRLGLRDAARPFLDALRALYHRDPGTIGNTTLLYWTDAVGG